MCCSLFTKTSTSELVYRLSYYTISPSSIVNLRIYLFHDSSYPCLLKLLRKLLIVAEISKWSINFFTCCDPNGKNVFLFQQLVVFKICPNLIFGEETKAKLRFPMGKLNFPNGIFAS